MQGCSVTPGHHPNSTEKGRWLSNRNPIGLFRYRSEVSGWEIRIGESGIRSVSPVSEVSPGLAALPPSPLREELDEYFQGRRISFGQRLDLPSEPVFSRSVWTGLTRIPWGQVRTYSELAETLGGRNLARAVAGACSRNPVALLVPCHRVVGENGPGGYSGEGGISLKLALLRIEGVDYPVRDVSRSPRGRRRSCCETDRTER
ncbi:methylated-DNA--[protein]-cysteine S-methyltransferase [Candidatus Fermentibacteria bacterium]|nr:methylated-DNA--[protein]-cysteine S-methyltransferase [Candidatus Fermentibacteria bacterium]